MSSQVCFCPCAFLRVRGLWHGRFCSADSVRGREFKEAVKPNGGADRKSTRLNSSHRTISYAVFCLKKKTNNKSRVLTAGPYHLRNRSCQRRPNTRPPRYTLLPERCTAAQSFADSRR